MSGEHYTSLAPGEKEHRASLCGCRLVRDELGRVKLFMCRMHLAAPIVKQALLQYVLYWENLQDIDEDDKRMLKDAKKALRMAGSRY